MLRGGGVVTKMSACVLVSLSPSPLGLPTRETTHSSRVHNSQIFFRVIPLDLQGMVFTVIQACLVNGTTLIGP